jgi:hypothetical protein
VKGAEMKAGCLYVSDQNLEERFNFKISVTLGKSVNASCAMLLEAHIYISCTEIKWYERVRQF